MTPDEDDRDTPPMWSVDGLLRASISASAFSLLFVLFLFALAKVADRFMLGGAL